MKSTLSKFDITQTISCNNITYISSRNVFIFSGVGFPSWIVSLHSQLPIYCCLSRRESFHCHWARHLVSTLTDAYTTGGGGGNNE